MTSDLWDDVLACEMFTCATADDQCELCLYTVKHLFTRMMAWHAKCHFRFPSVACLSSQVSPLQHRHISALREPGTRLRVRAILKWLSKTQNQSNRVITFDSDLKTTLIPLKKIFVYSNLLNRRNYKNVQPINLQFFCSNHNTCYDSCKPQ